MAGLWVVIGADVALELDLCPKLKSGVTAIDGGVVPGAEPTLVSEKKNDIDHNVLPLNLSVCGSNLHYEYEYQCKNIRHCT